VYKIEYSARALEDLAAIPLFHRKRIMDAVARDLSWEPLVPTRNRKPLAAVCLGFEHEPPVWELRVGDWRVFYDVEVSTQTVFVRAVRQKGRLTTEEVVS
jgi:mRNA-degrading endonuclease RelE of RelBE toxin-antitoxin system